jgi:hypothetical protein
MPNRERSRRDRVLYAAAGIEQEDPINWMRTVRVLGCAARQLVQDLTPPEVMGRAVAPLGCAIPRLASPERERPTCVIDSIYG